MGLDFLVNYGIYASQQSALQYINATGGQILEYNLDGKRYRSHTFLGPIVLNITNPQYVTLLLLWRSDLSFIGYYGGGGASEFNRIGEVTSTLSLPPDTAYIALDGNGSGDPWLPNNVTYSQLQSVSISISGTPINFTYADNSLWLANGGGPNSLSGWRRTNRVLIPAASSDLTTFTVTQLGSTPEVNVLDYLIIAGGGGSGGGTSGGGGAGGYRTTLGTSGGNSSPENKITPSLTSYSIVVGQGGAGNPNDGGNGSNGENSSAFGITSLGGGGGTHGGSQGQFGLSGGSGGGAGYAFNPTFFGGTGTTGQGFAGGNTTYATSSTVTDYTCSGGGGAGGVGGNAAPTSGAPGGPGLSNILRTGSPEFRGGGGAGSPNNGATALGGIGGGGDSVDGKNGKAGTPNTGGGAGGPGTESPLDGNRGGSGIVIVRYEIAPN